jgi:hypothetical protein
VVLNFHELILNFGTNLFFIFLCGDFLKRTLSSKKHETGDFYWRIKGEERTRLGPEPYRDFKALNLNDIDRANGQSTSTSRASFRTNARER